MLKKILPVIIITVCLLFAGCKAPADQEQKNNTEIMKNIAKKY